MSTQHKTQKGQRNVTQLEWRENGTKTLSMQAKEGGIRRRRPRGTKGDHSLEKRMSHPPTPKRQRGGERGIRTPGERR